MFKKFLTLMLAIVMLATMAGCNMFEPNLKKDYMQIVATIDPVQKAGVEVFGGKNIYKYQLINGLNQNGQTYSQQGLDAEQAAKKVLEDIIYRELALVEIQHMIDAGELLWRGGEITENKGTDNETTYFDYTDENIIARNVYSTIDRTLESINTDLFLNWDKEQPTVTDEELSTETTYPIKPDLEEVDDPELERETTPHMDLLQDKALWPGYFGDADTRSRGVESLRRFLALLRNNVIDNYAVTKDDEALFEQDDILLDSIINSEGYPAIYPKLIETHYIEFLIGKSIREDQKIARLNEYFEDSVTVTDSEVKTRYNTLLNTQMLEYNADISKYNSAMKDSSTTVLYHPITRFFYVKHILLPFSDAQTAALEKRKTSGLYTQPEIEQYRNQLVNGIVAYPHLNGENDLRNPMSVSQVFTDVKTKMAAASSELRVAERTFDDLIYLYNTDPGIFGNAKGYVEVAELEKGETNTYMVEFADAARKLYTDYAPGQVLPEFAVTDYGVHIMYYASKMIAGTVVGINDFESPAEYKTIYTLLEEAIKSEKQSTAFTSWERQNVILRYGRNGLDAFKIYENAYKDLIEE